MAKKFIVRADIPSEAAMIIKDQPIVTPGVYYGINLSEDTIKEHIRLTDWSDQYNKAVIYGHKTNTKDEWKGNPSPEEWAGYYTVPEYKIDGVPKPGAYSDIYIYDQNFAGKLAYGGVRCGVSATFDNHNGGFKNLSIIDNPKCKDAFLNLADNDEDKLVNIEPRFLNLADSPTLERGKNSNTNMNNTETDAKIAELNKQIEELKAQALVKEPVEPVVPAPAAPTPAPSDPEPVVPAVAPATPVTPAVQEPTPTPVAPVAPVAPAPVEPTVVSQPTAQEPVVMTGNQVDNSNVVTAIEKMTDKVTEELKKAADPQTVAPTDPASQSGSRDDEVTKQLVDKYSSLHNLE